MALEFSLPFRVQLLEDRAKLPDKSEEDAGYDLFSTEAGEIYPQQRTLVSTGIAIEIPNGVAGFVQPRSGLALKHGITVLNSPGLIDPGYRGEVKVILYNSEQAGNPPYRYEVGDKIAQLVLVSVFNAGVTPVKELGKTNRGDGGFGSTGR